MNHHVNLHGDACAKCQEIFDAYPNFHTGLRLWFASVRSKFFDAHVSCAGRGRIAQEEAFARRATHAHYGKSAHNYNLALDMFRLDPTTEGHYSLDLRWFESVFEAFPLGDAFTWYGAPGSPFKELPHIQVAQWYNLPPESLHLVEP